MKTNHQEDWGSDFEDSSQTPELKRKSKPNKIESQTRIEELMLKRQTLGPKPAISPKPRPKSLEQAKNLKVALNVCYCVHVDMFYSC